MGRPRTLTDFPPGPTGGPNASSVAPVVVRWQHPIQSTSPRMLLWPHALPVPPSHHPAEPCGAGIGMPKESPNPPSNPRVNPVIAVTGPPVKTPVPWEYPTGDRALLLWSVRPMTPHFSMRQARAGGRSLTSPVEPRVHRRYVSLSGRHDLSHRVGRHTTSAVAAHTGR